MKSRSHLRLRTDGLTVREVARALHISPVRVQQLEQRALEKLRRTPGVLEEFLETFIPKEITK